MNTNLETTDIFRGAYFLCMGGDLTDLRFRSNGKHLASFLFTGQDLHEHDKAYRNGHALVNPVQFRESLNHLRDILFEHLRSEDPSENNLASSRLGRDYAEAGRRYENDRERHHRGDQETR